MTATEDLIQSLAADVKPIRRLRPPFVRAAAWLALFVALVGVVTLATGAWPEMLARLKDQRFAVELAATFATGLAAVIAAFYLSLPDRSRFWAVLPVPPLVLWLVSSGYECYRNWIELGPQGWRLGRSADCFVFILTMSIPVAVALYWALRRAMPLDAMRVLVIGGLGVAALSAATLQFYHPFDVTVIDLAVHMIAIGIVIAIMTALGKNGLKIRTAKS